MTVELPVGPNVDWSTALASIRGELLRRQTGRSIPAPHTLKNSQWPPNYDDIHAWRQSKLASFEDDPKQVRAAKLYYKTRGIEFINHWCDIYEPRNAGSDKLTWMPFILFEKQEHLIQFLLDCLEQQQPGLIEKSRTMGATWVCVAFSVWMWLFWDEVSIGWGSQNAQSVDRIGDPKSIFEKIRMLLRRLPECFLPKDLSWEFNIKQYVCYNPETGSSIVGEVGENIGRGGRALIYFKDESAHYERPEKIEASLSETTNVPIDISSVNGTGNVFHRRREGGIDWHPGKKIEKGYVRVLVLDWRDHPEYDEEWYRTKRTLHERQGTLHIFAQEIERNYSASIAGVIIPPEYVNAAIDAHVKLGFEDDGGWCGGLDVADEGNDRNALILRKGSIVKRAEEWGERDTGLTARRAVTACREEIRGIGKSEFTLTLQYDCIGVGAGVKAETNRLRDDELLPQGLELVPWNAGGAVLNPYERLDSSDRNSPTNRDMYQNLKAQAWWEVRRLFENTYRAINEPNFNWTPDEVISLPSDLPLLHKLVKELSQATATRSSRLKMQVDKTPSGTKSPNLADALVMCYWPIPKPVGPRISIFGPKLIR